jgi:hypothetical protein
MSKGLFSSLLRLGRALLQLNVQRRAEQEPRHEVSNQQGEPLPYHGSRCFDYRSIFGDIRVRRAYYWCEGQAGKAPLDEALQRPERCYSYLLEQWALRLGVIEPFQSSWTNGRGECELVGGTARGAAAQALG